MQPVPRRGGERDPDVVDQTVDHEREQENEREKQQEDRQVKPQRVQTLDRVIDCQHRGNEWPIRLIARERAERRRVAEEARNIPQLADGGVVYERVRVVEMEAVVKMVRVGRGNDSH